ncbi:MAG TPA: DUF63 family protein [Candidatus Thermoplasmatota archaeon]|nr:DUF63 family protein [Candidatus Thermoplasmatota archaeon]
MSEPDPTPADAPLAEPAPAAPTPPWRAWLARNALWTSLGALALAGAVVAVGVQVAPETFYDRFWWEDIYGPLVVDARQCRTAADCPGLEGPRDVVVKDGYTVTSELTYGLVLATLLYGIYVGLFRRHQVKADGRFVLALLPWILLGPLVRALEDANVFCAAGTDCSPNGWSYLFISPVIYIHIALYVIAFMLLGIFLERRRHADPRLLTAAVGGVLGVGFGVYAYVLSQQGHTFSALPPLWFVLLVDLGALWLFWSRAREGQASMNLTLFALGLPWALGCLYLIGRWLFGYEGGVWVPSEVGAPHFLNAGAFIAAVAVLVASGVYLAGRALGNSRAEAAWGRLASRAPERLPGRLAYAGLGGIALFLVLGGSVPALAGLASATPMREVVVPLAGAGGLALLLAAAFLHVGHDAARRPGTLLVFAAGMNVALVFGHVLDGVATWVALEGTELFGLPTYSEKHPFSDFLLRLGAGPFAGLAFPIVKLVMVLVVAWVLDRSAREEGADDRNLVGLVKMAIFVLGFAPGLRDLLRLSMGV